MANKAAGMSRDVFLVDGCRTPFLRARQTPGLFSAADLAVAASRSLLLRQPFPATALDDVICGSVMPSADETNIARVVSLRVGCGVHVPAWTVQRNCASGLQAIDSASRAIASGRHHLVLAGGTDAMSRAPLLFHLAMNQWLGKWMTCKTSLQKIAHALRIRPRLFYPQIALLRGLTDPFTGLSMGQTAEHLAYQYDITRQQMDGFAVRSHVHAVRAQEQQHFNEITALYDTQGNYYALDDGIRLDPSLEKLARLKPMFDKPFGDVTAGNSSQITDGAAFVLLASVEAVTRYDLPVLAKIVDAQWAGLAPENMGLGPVHAVAALFAKHQLASSDIDYWEINEAFAAQVLACLHALADTDYCHQHFGVSHALGTIDVARVNVDGGAIALGHPVGASGARLVLHLAHILKRQRARRGIATLCIGGGQGGALLLENTEVVC